MRIRGASVSSVIAGLDPAIHLFRKNFDAKKMDHQNSGVPEFWPFRWTQIGNIRFAVVKPAGDAAGRGKYWINSTEICFRAPRARACGDGSA